MKFGKDFRTHLDETLPEWRDKFLSYKPLKKLIKNLQPDGDEGAEGHHWFGLEEWFVRILDEELEKFNDFYVDKEEEFVIRLQGWFSECVMPLDSGSQSSCLNYTNSEPNLAKLLGGNQQSKEGGLSPFVGPKKAVIQ